MRFPSRADVRMHGGVLLLCLALIYVVNLSTPGLTDRSGHVKGTDFIHFYVLGSLALHGRAEALYDYKAQAMTSADLVPESAGVYYLPIYGPQMSLLFAPLARLPYGAALVVWLLVTTGTYALCVALVWRCCPALRDEASTIIILAAASPAFFNLVAHGQNSAIALACLTAAFFALQSKRRFLAGLAIGTLIYKPQLGLAAAGVFVLAIEWRIIAGAIAGAALQLGAAWQFFGTPVMRTYWESVRSVGEIRPLLDIKPYQMHSLLSFWRTLLPWPHVAIGLYLACAGALTVIAWQVWRARAPLSLRYGVLLLTTVLVSPHLNVYDLVIVTPALLMCADWALAHPEDPRSAPVRKLLYFAYALPLFGTLTRFTHVQLSVPAMGALALLMAAVAIRPAEIAMGQRAGGGRSGSGAIGGCARAIQPSAVARQRLGHARGC